VHPRAQVMVGPCMSKRAETVWRVRLESSMWGVKFADVVLEPLNPATAAGKYVGDFPFHGY